MFRLAKQVTEVKNLVGSFGESERPDWQDERRAV